MKKNIPKLVVAVIASLYFLWCTYDPYQWHLIDGVNLVIHEAGHLIFSPFGEFMMIAGGSLFQVIMPALFVGYFLYHRKYYSAALVLFCGRKHSECVGLRRRLCCTATATAWRPGFNP